MTHNNALPIATKVAERVATRFPTVHIVVHRQVLEHRTATVELTSSMDGSVDVMLTVLVDGTYVLEAGPCLVFESDTEPAGIDAQVAEIAEQIESFGDRGVVKVRTHSFLGPLSPTVLGAPGADPAVDKWMTRRTSSVILSWKAWA